MKKCLLMFAMFLYLNNVYAHEFNGVCLLKVFHSPERISNNKLNRAYWDVSLLLIEVNDVDGIKNKEITKSSFIKTEGNFKAERQRIIALANVLKEQGTCSKVIQ